MKEHFLELQRLFVHLQFWTAAMTAEFKDDRLWILFYTADERIFIEVS